MTSSSVRRSLEALAAFGVLASTLAATKPATAPAVIAQVIPAQSDVRFTQLYKLRYLAAKSVADLLRRSFAKIQVTVIAEVNGITVVGSGAEQQRIADALAQLDVPSRAAVQTPPPALTQPVARVSDASNVGVELITLHAAIPGVNGAQSSNASDIASVVTQALSASLPDLHITLYANQSQLLITGSPNTIRIARELIDKLDALPKMVVLDVTIVEVDESVSKDLGLSLNPTVISTNYTETTPAAPLSGGAAPALLGLQQFSRTPLSIGLQLNLLIQNGKAKIVADPKLTTLSGRTATIRAGDNIAILTTTGGSVGTVATTQLVTFNTGVQLDITPVINAGDFISVALHPTVNNLSSILNGVPQISTRDVQTTVALHEGQTLIIGGLIEDSINRATTRIPILGYLPVVGPLFTSTSVSGQRNELIITVTPHIVDPQSVYPAVGPALTELPSATPLPALAPDAVLPPQRAPQPAGMPASNYIELPANSATGGGDTTPASAPATPAPPARVPSDAFVYGARPPAIPSAGPNDPPRVYYVQATPQLVRSGTSISIEAVTSSNVSRVLVQLGATAISLHQAGPGLWDATVPFAAPARAPSSAQITAVLSAVRADNVATTVTIPFTLAR